MLTPSSSRFSGSAREDSEARASRVAGGPAGRPTRPSGVLVGVSKIASLEEFQLPEGLPPLRILVVDDDAAVRKACCDIASGMGLVPVSAGSVPEARAAMKLNPVDLLLLDLKIPGEAACSCWKRSNQPTRRPV